VSRKSSKEGGNINQAEGYLPAPESAYSIACAIDEVLKCKEAGETKVIAFNI
jgi:tryptophan synthase beta chain